MRIQQVVVMEEQFEEAIELLNAEAAAIEGRAWQRSPEDEE